MLGAPRQRLSAARAHRPAEGRGRQVSDDQQSDDAAETPRQGTRARAPEAPEGRDQPGARRRTKDDKEGAEGRTEEKRRTASRTTRSNERALAAERFKEYTRAPFAEEQGEDGPTDLAAASRTRRATRMLFESGRDLTSVDRSFISSAHFGDIFLGTDARLRACAAAPCPPTSCAGSAGCMWSPTDTYGCATRFAPAGCWCSAPPPAPAGRVRRSPFSTRSPRAPAGHRRRARRRFAGAPGRSGRWGTAVGGPVGHAGASSRVRYRVPPGTVPHPGRRAAPGRDGPRRAGHRPGPVRVLRGARRHRRLGGGPAARRALRHDSARPRPPRSCSPPGYGNGWRSESRPGGRTVEDGRGANCSPGPRSWRCARTSWTRSG